MKKATLIALIASTLEMLMQLVYLSISLGANVFHLQIGVSYRLLNLISAPIYVLFTASLAYFFLVLYQNRKF
jgi:hypothetical protein